MENAQRELGFAEMINRKGRPKKKKAHVLKKSEVEEKLNFEMGMRDAATRLMSAASNPNQWLEAAKTILTSSSRTLALMTALQKKHVREVEEACGITELRSGDEISKEEMLETVSLADITLSNIVIPLNWSRVDTTKYKSDAWKCKVFCLVRCGVQVLDSATFTNVDLLTETITIPDTFVLKNLGPDFTLDFEFYYADDTTKSKKSKKEIGDASVPVFAIAATSTLSLAHCNLWQQKQSLKCSNAGLPAHVTAPPELPDFPPLPVLNFFRVDIDVKPMFTQKPSKQGFLDLQEMKGGLPSWRRCWCVLLGSSLRAWNRPEDEANGTEPLQVLVINEHIVVDHIAKSSVQRPHTIHVSYSKPPYLDFFLSIETKKERVSWEIALHKAMIDCCAWQPSKLSSAQNAGTCPSPLKSPPPKPPRPFSYTAAMGAATPTPQSNKRKLLDWTPKSRSKSAERRTPREPAPRSRVNSSQPKNKRRSRSVDHSSRSRDTRKCETPKGPARETRKCETPATSRDQRTCETPAKGNAPSSRDTRNRDTPASTSARGQRKCTTPIKGASPPKKHRESDATYVSMKRFVVDEGRKPSRPVPNIPPLPSLDTIPSNRVDSGHQRLQVDLSKRSQKKKAPIPNICARSPKQSCGGTNNLNHQTPKSKPEPAIMNLYNQQDSLELSVSIKKESSTASSTTMDYDRWIDEVFEGVQSDTCGSTLAEAPSFRPAHLSASGRKVARNSPLTSTMKEGAPHFSDMATGDITVIKGPRRLAPYKGEGETLREEEDEDKENLYSVPSRDQQQTRDQHKSGDQHKNNATLTDTPVKNKRGERTLVADSIECDVEKKSGVKLEEKSRPGVKRAGVAVVISAEVKPVESTCGTKPAVLKRQEGVPVTGAGKKDEVTTHGEEKLDEEGEESQPEEITVVREKPRFRVQNGKLVPM